MNDNSQSDPLCHLEDVQQLFDHLLTTGNHSFPIAGDAGDTSAPIHPNYSRPFESHTHPSSSSTSPFPRTPITSNSCYMHSMSNIAGDPMALDNNHEVGDATVDTTPFTPSMPKCCNSRPVGIHFDMECRFQPKTGVRLYVYNSNADQTNIFFELGFKHLNRNHILATAGDTCDSPRCRKRPFAAFFRCQDLERNLQNNPRQPCLDEVQYQPYKLQTHTLTPCLRSLAKRILKQNRINCKHLRSAPYLIKAICGGAPSEWVQIPTGVKGKKNTSEDTQGIQSFDSADFESYAKDRKNYYKISNRYQVISGRSVVIHTVDFKDHGALVIEAIEVLVRKFEVPSTSVTIEFNKLEKGSAAEIENVLKDVADAVFESDPSVLNIIALPFVFTEEDEDIAIAIGELNQIGALVVTVTDNKGECYERVKSVDTEDALIVYCTTSSGEKSSFPKNNNAVNWVCSRNENVREVSTSLTCCFIVALATSEYLCEENVDDCNIKARVRKILEAEEVKSMIREEAILNDFATTNTKRSTRRLFLCHSERHSESFALRLANNLRQHWIDAFLLQER
eukprot:TRINITY_DN2216_c0_g1_i1.p1 TRINITY_DN2216_c0_g1~~TRINITY_DN2216_c0_g1_i1.p1  ORF type:complete len:593 (-),score=55.63 TRINITY_DN2216_c0_g1_i1:124-1818(-)